ncbi:MAG: hypothetical protein Q8M56_06475 [Desulfobacterales bacterium]|jgi:hypothetical protein|nr:hypothetical protein [Desulfobacterales bacterium]
MMDRPRIFHRGVNPYLDHFNDEKTILGYHLRVSHPAFEIRIALLDERRSYF